jgi:Tol biopolymer transport system component
MSAQGNLPPQPARGKGFGAAIAALFAAFIVGVIGFAGGFYLGSRRAVNVVPSPSGKAVAYILEGRCAQGRCQSLWIGPDTKQARMVQALAGPSEEADEIAWTPDGSKVAFIVNGYQLRMFDAVTGKPLGALAIIDPDGFPSSRVARGVTFSSNGAAITYDDCPRDHSGCKPAILAIKQ